MIEEHYNEITQTPSSEFSTQTEVYTLENDFNYYHTSNNEFFYDQRSWDFDKYTNEVKNAAETLLKMSNDVSCWSKLSDSENEFVSKNEKGIRGFAEITGKMGCFVNDDFGILSNSLCAFTGVKKLEVGCSFCGINHVGSCSNVDCYEGNEQFKMMKRKCGSSDGEGEVELISPSRHNRCSMFSIVHLLSAVRLALVFGHLAERDKENFVGFDHQGIMCESYCLSVDEIVEHVRLRPGDPRILKSKAQVEDLIRGSLRVLSAQVSFNKAKKWRKLAKYDRTRKGWSWVGPIPCSPLDLDDVSAACSPEFWGVSKQLLASLVDCFGSWFKNNRNALIQRASLPPPPLAFSISKINLRERFDTVMKSSKSCSATIKPCLGEVRAYFHAEERIRYMIPDRAFAYTAVDGRKSSVAPVRKCGEKVSTRARDHNLLKCDRPSSITILTIVRDAAARLPGGIGTRGDVAVLVRDSQYLVEGISDEQMGQVVSGGLDRLHYERDPCVRFDRQKKLWVYLHGDREEEEFNDAGRRSTIIRWAEKGRRI